MEKSASYFVIDNTKYVIFYEKTEYKIYKEIDNNIEELTEEEKEKLNFVINQTTPEYHNSQVLDEIIESNTDMKLYGNIKYYLEQLEKLIPENLRNNFYNNLKTVKVKYNDYSIRGPHPFNRATGRYSEKDNTIVILTDYLEQKLRQKGYPEEEITKGVEQSLLHEFVHMASGRYDHEKMESHAGFDQDRFLPNTSITEGLTDIISIIIVQNKLKPLTGYNMDRHLVNQLILLTDWNLMINSYFGEKGTKDIEEYLNDLGKDQNISENTSQELFRHINTNYVLRNITTEFNELEIIQNTLLTYLDIKLNRLQNENKQEEIDKVLNAYSNWLITPERIEKLGYNSNIYVGLDRNEEQFNEIINKYQNTKSKSL